MREKMPKRKTLSKKQTRRSGGAKKTSFKTRNPTTEHLIDLINNPPKHILDFAKDKEHIPKKTARAIRTLESHLENPTKVSEKKVLGAINQIPSHCGPGDSYFELLLTDLIIRVSQLSPSSSVRSAAAEQVFLRRVPEVNPGFSI